MHTWKNPIDNDRANKRQGWGYMKRGKSRDIRGEIAKLLVFDTKIGIFPTLWCYKSRKVHFWKLSYIPSPKSQKAGDLHFWNLTKREKAGGPEKVVEITLKVDNLVKLLKNIATLFVL